MTFFDYLDTVYCNNNLINQKTFTLKLDGECKAATELIKFQRSYFRITSYFKLVFGYLRSRITHQYPEKHTQFTNAEPTAKAVPDAKVQQQGV